MKPSETHQVIALLVAAYPREVIKPETVDAYAFALKRLDPESVRRAALTHIAESRFFPSISELIALALDADSTVPPFDQAWEAVIESVRQHGLYAVPHFDHPAITEAVKTVGWRTICLSENLVADRAAFRDVYAKIRERHVRKVQRDKLKLGDGKSTSPRLTDGKPD